MTTKKNNISVGYITRRNLRWVLIWPNIGEEVNPGISYYIRIGIFCFTTGILYSSVLMHLILSLRNQWEISLSEDIAIVISLSGIYYITFTFIYKRPCLVKLLEDLSDFENFGKPPNIEKEERWLSMLSNAAFMYSVFATAVYTVVKYLRKPECERINKEKNLNENCGFIISLWIPFNIQHPITYQIVFLYVLLASQLFVKPALLISSCAFEFTRHIILRIKHLNALIQDCFEVDNYNNCKGKLRHCVQYHADILNLAEKLDASFSNTMFAHLTLTAIICATLEKQFIEDDRLCAGVHMFAWIVNLFLPCVAGQLLFNASESISHAVWVSKWYQIDVRLRKDIQFLLLRSQKKLFISAGPFGILSYPLFVSVMKMSYSVLCLLHRK